jgi:hypothetical protein
MIRLSNDCHQLGQIPGVNPSTMRGLDHKDKVMQKTLDFELPEMGLKGRVIKDEDFDVFFGKHVLSPYQYVTRRMFVGIHKSQNVPMSQSQEEEDSRALVEKVRFSNLPTKLC